MITSKDYNVTVNFANLLSISLSLESRHLNIHFNTSKENRKVIFIVGGPNM